MRTQPTQVRLDPKLIARLDAERLREADASGAFIATRSDLIRRLLDHALTDREHDRRVAHERAKINTIMIYRDDL